jgi:hypothetical protein
MSHFHFGAIDERTGSYVLPFQAERGRSYTCPICSHKVVLRAGQVRRIHFSHAVQSDVPCAFYGEGEGYVHFAAKLGLAEWLRTGGCVEVFWQCGNVFDRPEETTRCGRHVPSMSQTIRVPPDGSVAIEHRGVNSRGDPYVADVAVLGPDGRLQCVLEVRDSHRTDRDRPEPWFEVEASDVHDGLAGMQGMQLTLFCVRDIRTRKCPNCELIGAPWVSNIPRLAHKVGSEGHWVQVMPCVHCRRRTYSPVFKHGPRAVCELCLPLPAVKQAFVDDE